MGTKNYEGVGITVTLGTTGVSFELKDVNPPSWSKEVIDVSHLGQAANDFKMKIIAKLRDLEAAEFEVAQDPTVAYSTTFSSTELITIAFPDSIGSLAFWGGASNYDIGNNVMDDAPTDTITITPTNKNTAGTYVAPVWA